MSRAPTEGCEAVRCSRPESAKGGAKLPFEFTEDRQVFTVTDLKQYTYCPRVVFYTYCLPLLCRETFKMRASKLAHQEEALREKRRSLRAYGLPEGERSFDVHLFSSALGLRGRADMVIDTGEDLIPVDYKLTNRKPGPHFRLQLAAYGVMLEETSTRPVRRGYLYSMLPRKADEVRLTPQLRAKVVRTATAMRHMVEAEAMPPPPSRRGRCVACEFRRFCNDL